MLNKVKTLTIAIATASLLLPAIVVAQTNSAPTLKVVTPSDGQTLYGDKVPVLLEADNITLTDYQTNASSTPGQGHIHLWLDDAAPTKESAAKVTEDNFTYNDVAPGDHTLKAELVNNDHTSLTPPQVMTVKFKTVAVASSQPATVDGFDKTTTVVILVVVSLVILAAWWYTKEDDESPTKSESTTKKPAAKKTTKKRSSAKKKRRT